MPSSFDSFEPENPSLSSNNSSEKIISKTHQYYESRFRALALFMLYKLFHNRPLSIKSVDKLLSYSLDCIACLQVTEYGGIYGELKPQVEEIDARIEEFKNGIEDIKKLITSRKVLNADDVGTIFNIFDVLYKDITVGYQTQPAEEV